MPSFFGENKPGTSCKHSAGPAWTPPSTSRQKAPPLRVLKNRPFQVVLLLVILFVVGSTLVKKSRQRLGQPDHSAGIKVTERNLAVLQLALDQLREHCDRYPTTGEGLATLVHDPGMAGWRGPYILQLKPDSWKRSFKYSCTNDIGAVRLYSVGPDGVDGTPDDVMPPAPEEFWK